MVLGLAAAAGLTRFLASLLFEISPVDPLTCTAVSVVLLAAAAARKLHPGAQSIVDQPCRSVARGVAEESSIRCGL